MNTLKARRASLEDIGAIGGLYDAYRQFYGMPPDLEHAVSYLRDRLTNNDSVVFVAEDHHEIVAFCQLYPSFCSVFMGPIFVLYDLFVRPESRRRGAAATLLVLAEQHADSHGALRMDLKTARTNQAAQSLYEAAGWSRNEMFHEYNRMPRTAHGPKQHR
jgi:ribosomal protein S18 acetylase RimI-like enzyme